MLMDNEADVPANIGFEDGCHKALYTITGDGTIYAEWTEEYPFEIGHFLLDHGIFLIKDMVLDESRILVNGKDIATFHQ